MDPAPSANASKTGRARVTVSYESVSVTHLDDAITADLTHWPPSHRRPQLPDAIRAGMWAWGVARRFLAVSVTEVVEG